MQFLLRTLITAAIVAGVSLLARRSVALAAVLASLPLTSLLAIIWLYQDTHDTGQVSELSWGIFWAVLPSLLFFVALPLLLRWGVRFGWALAGASVLMVLFYGLYGYVLKRFGVNLL